MKPETEQLLGTLEILAHDTFVWEIEKKGEFNLWNLMISEGFVKETDIELVFEYWQNIEQWGTPTDQKADGYEYAPYREEEREDDDWNDFIAKQRQEYYQQLHKFCQENLQNIQAYKLQDSSFRERRCYTNFYVSIIVGKILENNWICLAPIVYDCLEPHNRSKTPGQPVNTVEDSLLSQIDLILNKITPITIYDYYRGGYNQTHQHQIVKGRSTTKTDAIALALKIARMGVWQLTQIEYADNDFNSNSRKLSQFMNQCLQDRTYCKINFWDVDYSYKFGRTPVNDWIGTKFRTEFEYNP